MFKLKMICVWMSESKIEDGFDGGVAIHNIFIIYDSI